MQRSTTELRARVLDTITRSYFTHKPGGGKACERFFEARSASARRSAKFGHGERRLPYQLFEHRAPHLADRTFELRLANVMDASPVGIFPTQVAPEHRAAGHERPVPFPRPRMVERGPDEEHDLRDRDAIGRDARTPRHRAAVGAVVAPDQPPKFNE